MAFDEPNFASRLPRTPWSPKVAWWVRALVWAALLGILLAIIAGISAVYVLNT